MSSPARVPAHQPAGTHWTHAAAVRATRGWPYCTAGCGWPVDPAATTEGHTTHPGCTPANPARRQIIHGRRTA